MKRTNVMYLKQGALKYVFTLGVLSIGST